LFTAVRVNHTVYSMLVVLLLAIGSFRVIRLVGFYALAVAFLIPPWTEDDKPRSESSPARLRAAFTCCALIAIATAVFGRALAMNAEWLPEREAAMFIKDHDLRGRMLTWFDYGEFAIWHFSPAVRVSMAGERLCTPRRCAIGISASTRTPRKRWRTWRGWIPTTCGCRPGSTW
jgi:hypothetical protein